MTIRIDIKRLIEEGPYMTVSTARREFSKSETRLGYRTLMVRAKKYGVVFKNERKRNSK